MDIRPDTQIQSMIKAMIDVVLPAVDPGHKMAQEQARLVISTLQLIARRLPIAYRYDRDELERYVALSRDLLAQVGCSVDGSIITALEKLAAHGSDVLDRARTEPSEMEAAIFDLRAAMGNLIRETSAKGNPETKAAVRRLILAASKQELDRERALVVDMGFESDSANMPIPIEKQLHPVNLRSI